MKFRRCVDAFLLVRESRGGRACAESREVTLAHIRVDITLSVLPVFRWNLSGCATCKAQNGCSDGMLVESSHSDRLSQLCCVGRGYRGQHSPHNDQYHIAALM